ncbi:Bcr/CflA family multidrug efflux MFS transporter [Paenibacillus sp. N1-5-1-14]|uniref:Bcr/CflA family multidrug efflux MFS transporter n=1 Tax=Paenibacillus radicibacter TaxID=2972488 RepID=UPI00215952A0|nr:Bcr/CflA family multidrug efflux MFS transporter [Paenibacillus radicibacter]MCR8643240.1 Bcr/CflA family multidrug efflux MFS transporter [Paenibacillus radicibacter]
MNTATKETVIRSAPLPRSKRLWFALILGALSAFAPLSIDMYLPSLPTLSSDLGTTTSLAQLSLTACLLGLALGQLIVGPLSDKFGRRKPLLISLVIYAVASLLCAFGSSIYLLIGLRFIEGATGAAGIVISRAMVRDMYEGSEMTKFFSLLMLVNGLAPILAPIVGGMLLKYVSWHGVFVVLALIGVVMFLAVLFGLPESLPTNKRSSGGLTGTLRTFGRLLKDRSFIGYALTQGFITAAMFGYISGSPFVLQDIFGVSPQMFSVIFAINGIGIIIASQVAGRLAGKVSETKLLVSGLLIAATGGISLFFTLLLDAGIIAVLIPLFLIVASVGIVGTASFALAMQNQGHSAGSASALLGLFPYVFGAIAAPLVGLGGNMASMPMGIVIAACEVGALLIYFFMVRRK